MCTIRFVFGSLFAGLMSISAQTYTFTTLAGVASGGHADGTGGAARFIAPRGVVVDGSGDVFVAEPHAIRKVTAAGVVTTLAGSAFHPGSADGTGSAARFKFLTGIALDGAGNLYVTDENTIRKISPTGVVSTLAGVAGEFGSADGTGSAARFLFQGDWVGGDAGIVVDTAGNIYVAETGAHTIRKVTADGTVTTLAGRALEAGSADGIGEAARFFSPEGLTMDSAGNLIVADRDNNAIRKVTPAGVVTTLLGKTETAGLEMPFFVGAVAVDRVGNVYVASNGTPASNYVGGSTIQKLTPAGVVTVIAGSTDEFGGEDGTGSEARFTFPSGLTMDGNGNIFVADTANNTIRKISVSGEVTTLAGTAPGNVDGTGNAARFQGIFGIAVDGARNVYVATSYSPSQSSRWPGAAIRKITADGVVTTLAGSAPFGHLDGTGTAARFGTPLTLAADFNGNVIVADRENHAIRKVTPAGVVTTIAALGSKLPPIGVTAPLSSYPSGVAIDLSGNVYVAESGFSTIRKVNADGLATTLAGSLGSRGMADGIGSTARFVSPRSVAVDGSGNVFVADIGLHTIRRISADGVVSTVAGAAGESGSVDGPIALARFFYPQSVAVDSAGNLFVVENTENLYNRRIRKITDGVVTTLKTTPTELGNFSLAVDNAGNLYATNGSVVLKGVPD